MNINVSRFPSYYLLLVVICVTSAGGCGQQPYPVEVAGQFWHAIRYGDLNELRRTVTSEFSRQEDLINDLHPVGAVTLGKTVIDGDKAWVDTDVEIRAADNPTITLKTVLVKEKNHWKVDYHASTALISRDNNLARVIGSMRELGDQIAGQLDEVIGEIQEAIPEVQGELEKLEKHIQSQIPILKEKFEEFSRELEETLKNEPEEPEQAELATEI